MTISTELMLLVGSVLFFYKHVGRKGRTSFWCSCIVAFSSCGNGFRIRWVRFDFRQCSNRTDYRNNLFDYHPFFSGGLDTRFTEIRPVIWPGAVLATLGVLITAILTGFFTYWLSGLMFPSLGISLLTAMLLASTFSSTDSASVFGILRSKGLVLKNNLRPLLELESGSNDPMAYMLTLMFMSIIQSGGDPNIGMVAFNILVQLVVGTAMGYLLGRAAVIIINRIRMDNASLYPILLLTFGVFIFALTYYLKGNGYLAVYIAGLVIGNSKFSHKRTSMKFMDGFAWMSQILLFLTLGLLVNPGELVQVLVPALIISFFLLFIGRPVAVFLSLTPFREIGLKDKLYVSWVGLRGAVPIIFAILPLAAGVQDARWIFNIVFVITIVSLLVQGGLPCLLLQGVWGWLKILQNIKLSKISMWSLQKR